MTLTVEAILIALVLLLPGFVANRLISYFSVSPERKLAPLDAALSSLGVSAAILLFQALLASIALTILWSAFRTTFDRLQLNLLVEQGIADYFKEEPLLFAATVASAAVLAIVLAVVMGIYDPVGVFLRRRLVERAQSDKDIWFVLLQEEKQRLGKKYAYVEIMMKESGDIFRGAMRGFSLVPDDHGNRDVALDDVTYIPGGDVSKQLKFLGSPPGAALLNSREIESIRVIFVD